MARALPFPPHLHPPRHHNQGLGLMRAANKVGGATADAAGQGEAGDVSEVAAEGAAAEGAAAEGAAPADAGTTPPPEASTPE